MLIPKNAIPPLYLGMAVRETKKTGFGLRLAELRKNAGMKQKELAESVGVSPRAMAAYETQDHPPPADKLPAMAKALNMTVDEILGVKPVKRKAEKKTVYLWAQVKKLEQLTEDDRKAAVKYIDALVSKSRRVNGAAG